MPHSAHERWFADPPEDSPHRNLRSWSRAGTAGSPGSSCRLSCDGLGRWAPTWSSGAGLRARPRRGSRPARAGLRHGTLRLAAWDATARPRGTPRPTPGGGRRAGHAHAGRAWAGNGTGYATGGLACGGRARPACWSRAAGVLGPRTGDGRGLRRRRRGRPGGPLKPGRRVPRASAAGPAAITTVGRWYRLHGWCSFKEEEEDVP
jgi:hypothetical protein